MSVRAVGAGGVEADPEELYRSVIGAGSRALAAAGAPADAVALANQGETVLAWDRRTGAPLTPAIVWQDRRSAAVCERLAGSAARLAQLTGLPLDPYFAAPKMTWLRENLTGDGVVTTTDTWLLARLGGGYVTDASTASRTMLLDLDAAGWSAEACGIFGLDPGDAAGGRRLRGGHRGDGRLREGGAGGRARRRPAGRAARRALFRRGPGQVHLRDRRVPARHHRGHGRALGQRPVRVDRLAAGRDADLLPGRAGLHRRRRHPVAGRDRPAPGRGRAGRGRRVGPGQRRGDVPAVAGRARRAALAPGGPRGVSRARPRPPRGRT